MAAAFANSSYSGALQLLLLDVLGNDSAGIISNTTGRIDYGINPMRDTYTQFFGYGMDATGSGWVSDIDIYWPNVGSVGIIIDGLPDIPMSDLFAVAEAANPLHALNLLLARSDWTGSGTNSDFGETFWGFYSAETITAGGGYDSYIASMGTGQARDIVDSFDGGAGDDGVSLYKLTTGVRVDMEAGLVTFSEEVSGLSYDRTIQLVSVEEVSGTKFRDTMLGSAGVDSLLGGAGRDVIRGAGGDDLMSGGAGNDRLYGGAGNDRFFGNDQADLMLGGGGSDTIDGGRGADRLRGGKGADQLSGGVGGDLLKGEGGADRLSGDGGNDRLIGGLGDDTLTGGKGADVFVFKAGGGWQGEDLITDFNLARDRLVLTGAETRATVSHDGADTVIDYDGGSVRLLDVLWPEEGVLSL